MATKSSAALAAAPAPAALFAVRPGEITQAPTRVQSLLDAAFRRLSFLFACCTILLVTFLGIVPVGLVWAQFEHVSLRKVAAESEQAEEKLEVE